jgi:hypothetical protein
MPPKTQRGIHVRSTAAARAEQLQRQQDLYLESLRKDGTLTGGTSAAHISPHTVYWWRENDETFPLREREAIEAFADMLEQEIVRRGVHGVTKPVYQGGELVGETVEYSDRLLELAAKAVRPGKFRERLDVTNTQNIVVRVVSARIEPAAVI